MLNWWLPGCIHSLGCNETVYSLVPSSKLHTLLNWKGRSNASSNGFGEMQFSEIR